MKNKNPVLPQMIQKLLDVEISPPINTKSNCDNCGEKNTIELIENYKFQDKKLKLEFEIPTYVCSNCEDTSYSKTSYKEILEKIEVAKGQPYVKIEITDDRILRYTLH